MWIVTTTLLLRIAQWIIESGGTSPGRGPLDAVWLGLYQAGTAAPGKDTPLSALIEATYAGYARQEIVWYPPYVATAGPLTLEGGSLFFQPSDSSTANTIAGLFLVDAATGGILLASQPLANPGIVLSSPLTIIKPVPEFQLPFLPVYGGAVVFS